MSYPFSSAFRAQLAESCGAFPRTEYRGPALKRSAVAITLVDAADGSGETAFLLTRRPSKMRSHPGQWALPGGRCDAGETLEQTALRELQEELGLSLPPEQILGTLDDYATRSGYVMAPVVTWLDHADEISPNPEEVASVHRVRLDVFDHDGAIEFLTIPESDRPVLRMHFGESMVHAPTAALIFQLKEIAAGRITRVADFEQPVFAWK